MRTGRPTPAIVLTAEERETGAVGAPPDDGPSARATGAHRVGVCDGQDERPYRRGGRGYSADGGTGAPGSRGSDSMACSMNRGQGPRGRSWTPTWNRCSG